MKNFDSRTYSINDYIEWENNKQLELSPKFQRRSVWSDSARSYLMDTILQGKPIPKVFIRQKLNPKTKKSMREVVDGQQRLRTILSFIKDGFQVNKKHNDVYGGLYYSQLDEDVQTNILNYEISTDLLVNMSDVEVLDVFSRLNSYSVTLNTQEKLNANHFGPFKSLAEKLAHLYHDFWINNTILTNQKILRMEDVYLTSDILIAMLEGIQTKKKIPSYYEKYEKSFSHDPIVLAERFGEIMILIDKIFPNGLSVSTFKRVHLFYTLFTTLYHMQYGLPNLNAYRNEILDQDISKVSIILEGIEGIFVEDDIRELDKDEAQFLLDSRRATTDKAVRERRTIYLLKLLESKWK